MESPRLRPRNPREVFVRRCSRRRSFLRAAANPEQSLSPQLSTSVKTSNDWLVPKPAEWSVNVSVTPSAPLEGSPDRCDPLLELHRGIRRNARSSTRDGLAVGRRATRRQCCGAFVACHDSSRIACIECTHCRGEGMIRLRKIHHVWRGELESDTTRKLLTVLHAAAPEFDAEPPSRTINPPRRRIVVQSRSDLFTKEPPSKLVPPIPIGSLAARAARVKGRRAPVSVLGQWAEND